MSRFNIQFNYNNIILVVLFKLQNNRTGTILEILFYRVIWNKRNTVLLIAFHIPTFDFRKRNFIEKLPLQRITYCTHNKNISLLWNNVTCHMWSQRGISLQQKYATFIGIFLYFYSLLHFCFFLAKILSSGIAYWSQCDEVVSTLSLKTGCIKFRIHLSAKRFFYKSTVLNPVNIE